MNAVAEFRCAPLDVMAGMYRRIPTRLPCPWWCVVAAKPRIDSLPEPISPQSLGAGKLREGLEGELMPIL